MSAPRLTTHRAASVDAMEWGREHRGTEAQRQPAEDERAVLRGLPERRRGQLLELVDEHEEEASVRDLSAAFLELLERALCRRSRHRESAGRACGDVVTTLSFLGAPPSWCSCSSERPPAASWALDCRDARACSHERHGWARYGLPCVSRPRLPVRRVRGGPDGGARDRPRLGSRRVRRRADRVAGSARGLRSARRCRLGAGAR